MALGRCDLRDPGYLSDLYVLLERQAQCLDQQFVVEWFTHESHRPARQCSFACIRFIVRGDEDNGEPITAFLKSLLHIKTVQPGHLDIKNDTVRMKRWHRFDEIEEVRPEANVSASIPSERTSRMIARHTDLSSSTIAIIGLFCVISPLTQKRVGNKNSITPFVVVGNSSERREACILDLGPIERVGR